MGIIYMVKDLFKKYKSLKYIITVIFLSVLIITAISVYKVAEHNRIEQIENNKAKWKKEAIIEPSAGSLKAAGYITISWNNTDAMEEAKGYKVFVDGEQVAELSGDITTYEFYATKVKGYDLYVEANLKNGSVINSDIITFYVNKKGLCVNKDMANSTDAKAWGTSWYYDWGIEPLHYTSFQDMEFVPMIWGNGDHSVDLNRFSKFGFKSVLAYNEPDMFQQANIEVDDAVEGMKEFMDRDLRVGSPATALLPPWSDEWFQPFMEKMKENNLDVDFIAIHHYWNWYNDEGAQAFIDLVKETYEMYHKPIWITEFAITGDPGRDEMQRQSVIGYMEYVLPKLDELEYVERYAWFSFSPNHPRHGASGLINSYEGTITDLGKLYIRSGMPEGYRDKSAKQIANEIKDIVR